MSKVQKEMPLISLPKNTPYCKACNEGKQVKAPALKVLLKITSRPLELVHIDLCGPFPISIGGAQYIMTFTDNYSRFTIVYFLKHKSESLVAFQSYKVVE